MEITTQHRGSCSQQVGSALASSRLGAVEADWSGAGKVCQGARAYACTHWAGVCYIGKTKTREVTVKMQYHPSFNIPHANTTDVRVRVFCRQTHAHTHTSAPASLHLQLLKCETASSVRYSVSQQETTQSST